MFLRWLNLKRINLVNFVTFNFNLLRTFYPIFVLPLLIIFGLWFFSKWSQTRIAIFWDFLIYNCRFRKKHFSVENYHIVIKLDKNVYFKISFKVIKVFWKIGIFTHTFFPESAIIYKEILKDRNFRLTSFGKKIINQKILTGVTQKFVKMWTLG